jgi:hypothetical protein
LRSLEIHLNWKLGSYRPLKRGFTGNLGGNMDKDLAEALEKYLALWLEELLNNKARYQDSYQNADEMQQAFLEDLDENIISQFADAQDWEEFFTDLTEDEGE